MAVTIVAGAPFAGKSRWAEEEIARRESENDERGLLLLDYTHLYLALVPGVLDQFRAPGFAPAAPMVSYVRGVVLKQAVERELDIYVTVQTVPEVKRMQREYPDSDTVVVDTPKATARTRSKRHVAELVRQYGTRGASLEIARADGLCETAINRWFDAYEQDREAQSWRKVRG